MWFIKRKSADHAVKELMESLSNVLGGKLLSILIYGSKASGEFHDDHSDVNVFMVLADVSEETLKSLSVPLRTWMRNGHPLPVFIQKSELQAYADSLPIEFLDMQEHHKVIFGSDVLSGLHVNRAHLRAQCQQELSIKLLKLRQAVLLADGHSKRLRELLTSSLPSVLTLYRAALRLESDIPKGGKIVAAQEFSKRAGFDGDALARLWEVHMRRQTDNMQDLAQHYLVGLQRALTYLHQK